MAEQLSDRVLQIAKIIGEPLLLAQAQRRHGWCRFCQGKLSEARALLEAALQNQVSSELSQGDLAYDDATTLATLAWLDWLTEGNAQALSRAAEAAVRAEASPRPLSAAYTFGFLAIVHQLCSDPDGSERYAARCRSIANERGIVYFVTIADALSGWCQAVRDRSSDGLQRLRSAVTEYRNLQGEILLPHLFGLLAETEHSFGSEAAALVALDQADAVVQALGAHVYTSSLLLARSRIAGRATAQHVLPEALRLAQEQGANALAAKVSEALKVHTAQTDR
jgi:hypothetical protein